MPSINASLNDFAQALKERKAVNVTKNGQWYVEGLFMRFVRWLFDLHGSRIRNVAGAVHKIFLEAGRAPVQLNGDFTRLKAIIRTGKSFQAALKDVRPFDYEDIKYKMKRTVTAMRYWVGPQGGGLEKDAVPNAATITKLTALATRYKKSLWQFKHEREALHPADLKQIKDAACYPKFVKLLEKSKTISEEFFSNTIRYLNPPDVFIEHPEVSSRIKSHYISGSIGRFAYLKPLKIEIDQTAGTKTITMPFGGRDQSIVDPRGKVALPGEAEIPLQTVFDDMKNKGTTPGEYVFSGEQGFIHYKRDKLESKDPVTDKWNSLDLTQEKWWEGLPAFEPRVAKVDIMARYNLTNLEDNQWVILSASAKKNERTRFDDCHGFAEMVVPNGDGTWGVYPVGNYPSGEFPATAVDYLKFVCDTRPAEIVFHDYNQEYGGIRQYGGHVRVTDEEGGKRYAAAVLRDIIRAREGRLFFQFGWDNCACKVQRWSDEAFGPANTPRFYLAPVVSAGCVEPLDTIICTLKDLPKGMEEAGIAATARALGSKRKVVNTTDDNGNPVALSLYNSPFIQGIDVEENGVTKRLVQHIHLPSQIHRNIEQGKFEGIIWSGFQRVQTQAWINS